MKKLDNTIISLIKDLVLNEVTFDQDQNNCSCASCHKNDNKTLKPYQQFKQVSNMGGIGMIPLQCPSCSGKFGIPTSKIEEVGESSYLWKYFCPHCGEQYTVQ